MIIIPCDNCRRCEIITEINDKTGKALLNKGWIVKRFDGTWHDLCSENSYQRYIKEIIQKMIGW